MRTSLHFLRTLSLTFVTLTLSTACSADIPSAQASTNSAPDGIWHSDGYGYIYNYEEGQVVQFFDVTPDICRPDQADELALENKQLGRQVFRLGEDGNTLFLSTLSSPHEIRYDRIESIPEHCNRPADNSPMGNFDAFVSYFSTHYPFFETHGVDWDAVTSEASQNITTGTSDRELYDTLKSLLQPLNDLHVSIEAEVGAKSETFRASQGTFNRDIKAYAERIGISRSKAVRRHQSGYWKTDIREILGKKPKTVGRDGIKYGITPNNVGYVAIMAEGNYVRGDNLEKDVAATQRIMDDILSEFNQANVKAVIVDVSANMGGYDAVSLAIAGHFTDTRELAYTKQAGDASDPVITSLYVAPAKGARFTGPTYILTADMTRSAGETLTLAMRALPNVTHAGQKTRGSLSDEFYKALPNGWYISMSNEIYKDPEGRIWEGVGIEPELPLTVFETEDPTSGRVEAVRALMTRSHKSAPDYSNSFC